MHHEREGREFKEGSPGPSKPVRPRTESAPVSDQLDSTALACLPGWPWASCGARSKQDSQVLHGLCTLRGLGSLDRELGSHPLPGTQMPISGPTTPSAQGSW